MSVSRTEWEGVIFIRQGLYHNAMFKFVIDIPELWNQDVGFLTHKVPIHAALCSIYQSRRSSLRWRRRVSKLESSGAKADIHNKHGSAAAMH